MISSVYTPTQKILSTTDLPSLATCPAQVSHTVSYTLVDLLFPPTLTSLRCRAASSLYVSSVVVVLALVGLKTFVSYALGGGVAARASWPARHSGLSTTGWA